MPVSVMALVPAVPVSTGPVMISLFAFAPVPWLATRELPTPVYCAFNCVTAAAMDVPAAKLEVTAVPPATPTLSEPETESAALPKLNVAVAPALVVDAVGVGFATAEVTPTGAESPTLPVVNAPTVSEYVFAPLDVPSLTNTVFAVLENTELLLKFVLAPMLPI